MIAAVTLLLHPFALFSNSSALGSLPSTMRSVHVTHPLCFTPFTSCIKERTVAVPTPGPGMVLIKVEASSVNPCDVDYVEYGVGCSGGGGTLGMDASGTVAAVGSGVDRLKVGDAVWADGGVLTGVTGTMAEYALLHEQQTGLMPRSLNFTEAGTVPLVGLTATECLLKAGAPWKGRANLTVLITSGTGGTGTYGVQLAKRAFGASHVVTAASGAGIAFAKSLGADSVIDYKVQDVLDAQPAESVDIVFDNYGAKGSADKAMRALRTGGTYLLLPGGGGGTLSKHPRADVTQINFGYTNSSDFRTLDMLATFFDAGALKAYVYDAYPLEQAAAAFALSKAGHIIGKVAVTTAL